MLKGLLAGLGAGALWGLVFVLPRLIPEFSGVLITLGRYGVYGLLALGGLVWSWHRGATLPTRRQWLWALGLSLIGNTLYYWLLVHAIRGAGTGISGLIIGTVPLWVMLLGRPHGLLLRELLPGLLATAGGLGLMHWQAAQHAPAGQFGSGVLYGVLALLIWTGYALLNARFIQRQGAAYDNSLWTNTLGVATLVGMLPLATLGVTDLASLPQTANWTGFALISLLMGAGSSWLATWLWNHACHSLPTSLAGQLIISETLFALLFGFMADARWPNGLELTAALLFTVGILLSLHSHRRTGTTPATEVAP